MRVLFLLTAIFWPNSGQAFFQKIWKGFLQTEDNQIKELDKKLNEIDYIYKSNLYTWDLSFSAVNEVSNPASLISFQNQETTTDSAGISLNRRTYKYGNFTLAHKQSIYDLSEWTNRIFLPGSAEILYEVKNSFTYNYDFLDKSGDYDYELIQTEKMYKDIKTKLEQHRLYLDFFKAYLQAKADFYTVKLTKEFEKRAAQRVAIIARRVRDGLSRNIDLLQARTSLLTQKELLNTSRSALKSSLAIIEDIVGQKIPESILAEVSWPKRSLNYWKAAFKGKNHLEVDLIKLGIEQADLELNKLDSQNGMKLGLSASYIANAVDESRGEALDNAAGDGDNITRSLALTWTLPLGLDRRDSLKQKISYTKKKNELQLSKSKGDIIVQKSALREQIMLLDEAYELASKKIVIADELLDQQSKLFYKGQATFDDVIRADESFINANLNRSKIIAQLELVIAEYAFLHNGVVEFLNLYTD